MPADQVSVFTQAGQAPAHPRRRGGGLHVLTNPFVAVTVTGPVGLVDRGEPTLAAVLGGAGASTGPHRQNPAATCSGGVADVA